MPLSRITAELAAKIRGPTMIALKQLRTTAETMGALGVGGVYEFAGSDDVTMVTSSLFAPHGDEVSISVIIRQTPTETLLSADLCTGAHVVIELPETSFRSLSDVEAFDADKAINEFFREAAPVFVTCLAQLKAQPVAP